MEITACMVTYNEAENIEMAIESAMAICTRIVIVDDGSLDKTVSIAKKTCERLDIDNTIILLKHTGKIYDTRSLALKRCKGDWILVTDGDFIWHTSGTNHVKGLPNLIRKRGSENLHVYSPLAYLYGDYWHTLKTTPVGYPHPYFIKNHSSLKCIRDQRFFKYSTKDPIKKLSTTKIFGFHAGGVKSAEMLLYRRFWTPWRELNNFKKYPTAWDYMKHNVGDNIALKSKRYFRDYMLAWMRFNSKKYSYYPKILKKRMKDKDCLKLIYNGKRIVGRNDIGDVSQLKGSFMKEGRK